MRKGISTILFMQLEDGFGHGVPCWKRSAGTPPPLLGQSLSGAYNASSTQLRNMLFVVFVGVGTKVYGFLPC